MIIHDLHLKLCLRKIKVVLHPVIFLYFYPWLFMGDGKLIQVLYLGWSLIGSYYLYSDFSNTVNRLQLSIVQSSNRVIWTVEFRLNEINPLSYCMRDQQESMTDRLVTDSSAMIPRFPCFVFFCWHFNDFCKFFRAFLY